MPAPPKRLIALAPNLTEILYALGLGDRVVGVTNHCNYPPEASLKPKVGSYIHLNVEQIISLSPDLVIGTVDGNERYVLDLLEQAHIKVFFVNPTRCETGDRGDFHDRACLRSPREGPADFPASSPCG